MAEKVTADIGFEKQIWNAACVLRGNMDASEYKSVVLGLIFLKYISDRFEAKYQELVDEGDGFEEDIDEYTSEGIFFVPAGARWNEIARKLGTMVSRKLRELTEEDIQKIAGTHKAFVNGTLEEQKGYCAVVTTEDIAKQDYILTPGRYVPVPGYGFVMRKAPAIDPNRLYDYVYQYDESKWSEWHVISKEKYVEMSGKPIYEYDQLKYYDLNKIIKD